MGVPVIVPRRVPSGVRTPAADSMPRQPAWQAGVHPPEAHRKPYFIHGGTGMGVPVKSCTHAPMHPHRRRVHGPLTSAQSFPKSLKLKYTRMTWATSALFMTLSPSGRFTTSSAAIQPSDCAYTVSLSVLFNIDNFSVSPDPFQIIERTVFPGKNMNDDITVIHKNPGRF